MHPISARGSARPATAARYSSEHTCRAAGLALDDTAYLVDLGEHRLKDFERSVRILQLGAERFPR